MQESVVRELLTYLLEPTFCLSIINPGWPDYGAAESIRGYRKNSADLLRLSLGFIGWREISFHFAEIKVFAMPRMGLAVRISPSVSGYWVCGNWVLDWTLRSHYFNPGTCFFKSLIET